MRLLLVGLISIILVGCASREKKSAPFRALPPRDGYEVEDKLFPKYPGWDIAFKIK